MRAPDYEHIKELEIAIDRIINRDNYTIEKTKVVASDAASDDLIIIDSSEYGCPSEVHDSRGVVDVLKTASYGFDFMLNDRGQAIYDTCFYIERRTNEIMNEVNRDAVHNNTFWKSHHLAFSSDASLENTPKEKHGFVSLRREPK